MPAPSLVRPLRHVTHRCSGSGCGTVLYGNRSRTDLGPVLGAECL
jgi:hypothetical protein